MSDTCHPNKVWQQKWYDWESTPCLECVHASVHEFMYWCLYTFPCLGPQPDWLLWDIVHKCTQLDGQPGCHCMACVCVHQSSVIDINSCAMYTLVRMCTCITQVYMNLCPAGHKCMYWCVHILNTPRLWHSDMESPWVSLTWSVRCKLMSHVSPNKVWQQKWYDWESNTLGHPGFSMCTCISTWIYVMYSWLNLCVVHPTMHGSTDVTPMATQLPL